RVGGTTRNRQGARLDGLENNGTLTVDEVQSMRASPVQVPVGGEADENEQQQHHRDNDQGRRIKCLFIAH
ncbi:MAG: hypothetical protein GXP53_08660, partial [Deltaproteobacteria bacterium]|nr:hypothetical protein [Deltaproteobacteria bacterium]